MDNSLLENSGCGRLERIVVARMKVGVDLLEGIQEAVCGEGVERGIFITGIGALRRAVFRNLRHFPREFPVRDENRLYVEINQPLELVSLTGHISLREDGEPNIHAHFSASMVKGDTVVTLGGHLTPGTITSIKVAVAIAVLEEIPMISRFSTHSMSHELFIG
jgi:predicted DNA-binding protein with PD1-like motif